MPLDPPQTSASDITWIVNGSYNTSSATSFQLHITTEGGTGSEAEGDAFLQDLVNTLAARYPNVNGTKGYTSYTTRNMTLS